MRALLVEHDTIFRDVIDKRHGHLFKHTGDGMGLGGLCKRHGLPWRPEQSI